MVSIEPRRLARGDADADRRRTRARFRQHLVGARLADASGASAGRPVDVVDWAAHARVLPPEDAEWLTRGGARAMPRSGGRCSTRALELREDIYRLGVGDRRRPAGAAASAIESLTRIARALPRARRGSRRSSGRFAWSWSAARGADRGGARADFAFGADDAVAGRSHPRQSSARARNAAGCSSTRPRTRAAAGARWKCAAIAPSRSGFARAARGA